MNDTVDAEQQENVHPDALRFSVDSQLVGELGERLVTRNHVALAELVKNAYDADATSISIEFCDYCKDSPDEEFPSIVLEDDGHGMPFADVEEFWMRIATANKARTPLSPMFGRPKTGNKGIGRFACQRLSGELILTTVAKLEDSYERTKVSFDWSDFKAGTTLTSIPCEYESETIKSATTGTKLELIDLKDDWLQRDFNTLRRSISWLTLAGATRRKEFTPDPGFAIELDAQQFNQGEGLILDQIVDAGWGRLRGQVLADGRASLKLEGNYLNGIKTWKSTKKFPSLSGVTCDISFFTSGESYELIRNKNILTKSVLGDLRDEAGVRVYYESFRVFPMGERGDDWLGLNRDAAARKSSFSSSGLNEIASRLGLDSRTALLRPRNENLLGRVEIKGKARHALQIKMNREGFVESASVRELISFLRLGVDWMTIYYAQARNRFDRQKAKLAAEDFLEELNISPKQVRRHDRRSISDTVTKAIDFLTDRAVETHRTKPLGVREKRTVARAEQVIETHLRELDSEIGVLRTLASTAPLLFTFSHEVGALIGRLRTDGLRIEALSNYLPREQVEEAEAIAASMRETADNFNLMSELFEVITSVRQSRPGRHDVKRELNKLVKGTKFTTDEAGIDVQVSCSETLKSPRMFKAEFLSIAVNLYSNAIKSCLASEKHDKAIRVLAREVNGRFLLTIQDRGVGLPKRYWNEVFEPFCSDPAEEIYSKLEANVGDATISALGRGAGLGLSIVKGICDDYGASISISEPNNWSFAIRASFPLEKRIKNEFA